MRLVERLRRPRLSCRVRGVLRDSVEVSSYQRRSLTILAQLLEIEIPPHLAAKLGKAFVCTGLRRFPSHLLGLGTCSRLLFGRELNHLPIESTTFFFFFLRHRPSILPRSPPTRHL